MPIYQIMLTYKGDALFASRVLCELDGQFITQPALTDVSSIASPLCGKALGSAAARGPQINGHLYN
jgi:hypothetical protein